MADFRYQGASASGRQVQGVLTANNKAEAKKTLEEICRKRQVRLISIQKKATFTYKIQKGNEKPIKGEQPAFSKEEVESALQKMGYKVLSVRKKPFDFKLKPPAKDVSLFIRICADLMREKLPYDEILELVGNDTENKALRDTIKEIGQDLKAGKEGSEVFGKHEKTLGKFTTFMLAVASTSGNMAEVYESTAKFLERNEEFKKSIKSALIMPAVIVVVLTGAVVYYVAYIFPETANMFIKFGIELPPMTAATLDLSNFLTANIWWIAPVCVAPMIALVAFIRTPRGTYLKDRYLIKIPVIGSLMHKTSIEIFARVFYALYSGSGENIKVIQIAAEACRNTYMESQIKNIAIPAMIKEGKGLIESLESTEVFTINAISRLRSGAETGALRTTAKQLADYYEKETSYKMANVVELINVVISMFIMVVMMALTLVSSETAVIKPKSPGT